MTIRRSVAVVVGAALAAGHALALVYAVSRAPEPLRLVKGRTLERPSPRAALYIDGAPAEPSELASMTPGLRHVEWVESFRGGHRRSVGFTRLVGPFWPVERPVCGVSLWIGDQILVGGKHTVARRVARELDAGMRGFERWPLGRFQRSAVSLRFARAGAIEHPYLRADLIASSVLPDQPYLHADITLYFDDAEVSAVVAVVPGVGQTNITVKTFVRARVRARGVIARAAIDLFNGNAVATSEARDRLEETVAGLVAKPPPIRIGDTDVELGLCPTHPLDLIDDWLVVRLALPGPGDDVLVATPPAPLDPSLIRGDISLSIDLPATNALLHLLWKSGEVDRLVAHELESLDLEEWLTIAIESPRLKLPPVVERQPRGLTLGAEVELDLTSGSSSTDAQLFARAELRLAEGAPLPWSAELSHLDLTCRRRGAGGAELVACFDPLEAVASQMAPRVHGTLGSGVQEVVEAALRERPGLGVALQSLDARAHLGSETAQIIVDGRFRLVE